MASSFMSRLRAVSQSRTDLSKEKIQRAVSAVFEPLEDRRLFSLYQVSVLYGNTTPNRGLTAITMYPSGATATSSGNVNAANELAAAQAAITVSGLPSGWTSSVLTAGNTGHKADTNEESLAEAKNLAPDQIVVGIEDHGAHPVDDNDYNDYYWLVSVAPYYVPFTPPDSGVYPPPSTSNEGCCPNSNTPSQEAANNGSGMPCPNTGAPVAYADGSVQYSAPELESGAGAVVWGETRSWTNRPNQAPGNKVGNNSVVTQLPRVEADGSSQTRVVLDGKNSVNFNITGSVGAGTDIYGLKHFGGDTLVRTGSSSSESYKMTDSMGNVTELYGLNSGIPAAKQGQLKSFTDSDGLATTTTYDSTSNLLTDVRRDLGGGVTESFLYDYYASGDPNAGLVHAVTLRRSTDGGTTWSNVRRSEYSYYEGTGAGIDAFGNLGDLRSSAVIDPAHDLSVSSLTRSGTTATLTTSAAHGYSVGDTVTVDGAAHRQYNGTFVVTGVTSTTLSYTMVSDPGANETSPSGVKVNKAIDDNYYRYYTPRVVSGSSVSWDGSNSTVTLTLSNNGLAVGDTVTVAGVTGGPAQYDGFNGSFRVTAATGTTFSYQVPFVNLSTTAPIGTITAVGNGYAGGMRYIFDSKAFARLSTNVSDPMAATDASVSGYATNYFEYDSNRRVKKEVAQDSGCSTCANGFGTTLLSYATSTNTADYNAWNRRTIEDMSDGNRNVVYTNGYGEMMLKVFQQMGSAVSITGASYASGTATITTSAAHGYSVGDVVAVSGLADNDYNGTVTITAVTGTTFSYAVGSAPVTNAVYSSAAVKKVISQQGDFYHYDSSGRVTLHADPSALQLPPNITAIEANADLMNYNAGTFKYQYLRDSQGLIETTTYAAADSGTITETVAGDAAGYVQSKGIERGQTGTNVPQESFKYYKRTAGGTVYPVALDTVYRLTGGSGAETTTYSYTWYSGTTRKSSMTTTLPLITTSENGPGGTSNDSSTTNYDVYGRPTSTTDGDGFVSTNSYDPATGAMSQGVTDSGTGHLNLTTTDIVDNMGRATKTTDPNGNVTYAVYNDVNHEVRVYPGWNATTGTTTGPIQITREDRGHQYTETLTSSTAPTTSGTSPNLVPTGAETISAANIQTLSRDYVNDANQIVYNDRYFSTAGLTYSTAANIGTLNTNYYRTQYDYEARGRLKRTIESTGTINWNVYDGLGRVVSTWIGTNDTGFTNSDPSGGGASGNNMKKVADYQYDGGGVGDSHLTKTTLHPDTSASDDRITEDYYDWRGRLVAEKSGVQSGESTTDTVQRQLTWMSLDNLGEATASYTYDGDGITINRAPEEGGTDSDGIPNQPSSGSLRYEATTSYDEQGRVYRSDTYSVDPSSGTTGNAVELNTFFDHRGNAIEVVTTGSAALKYRYDGAGRQSMMQVTDCGGDSGWFDADDASSDKVLEQSQLTYDGNSNVILMLDLQRDHDYTGLGDLINTSGNLTRATYQATYYDAADRLTDNVDVGTNPSGSVQWTYTRASSVPTRSDTSLVTSYTYNAAGEVETVTDPRNIASKTYYDLAGRTTKTIAGYGDGTPSASDDQTTLYTYDGDDHVLTLTADLPTGQNDQVTAYTYGVTQAGGNGIDSNDLLKEVAYPNTSTGAAGTTNADKNRYTYNALGEAKTTIDQNGTTHTYSYDVLGRMLSDDVGTGTLPTGVDGSVRKIAMSYDSAGRLFNTTSTNASAAVVNQTQETYNGLGQLTADIQDHNGAVSSGSSRVQYSYDTSNSSGVLTKESRLKNMTSPNGRIERYEYGFAATTVSSLTRSGTTATATSTNHGLQVGDVVTIAGSSVSGYNGTFKVASVPTSSTFTYVMAADPGANASNAGITSTRYDLGDSISRVSFLADDFSGSVSTHLEEYTYMGLGTIVQRRHPQSGVDLTLIKRSGEANGDGGDQYNGLDRFGRVADQRWVNATAGTDVDRYKYGYDANSNVLFKNNAVSSANSELYSASNDVTENSIYDPLNRLQGFQRGTLSAAGTNNGSLLDTVSSPTRTQVWSLDALGNWGNTTGSGATGVTTNGAAESRTTNSRNQLTAQAGNSLAYDANGNMTTNEQGQTLVYDAWNRMVGVKKGTDTVESFSFDGSGRRATETAAGQKTDVFYNGPLQVVERRVGSIVKEQDVWSLAYVNALVERDQDPSRNAGALDTSFSSDGKQTADLGSSSDVAYAVTVQPADGKIVAVGRTGSTGDFAIARFNADGSLDTTFSGDGLLTIDMNGDDGATQAAILPDGRILVGGTVAGGGDWGFVRLLPDGTLDPSFNGDGNSDGKIIANLGGADSMQEMQLLPDGTFLGGGVSGNNFAVAKFNADGSLYSSFGSSGIALTNFTIGGTVETSWADALAVNPSTGSILIAGYCIPSAGASGDIAAARFTSGGVLDTSFNSTGKLQLDIGGLNGYEGITDAKIQRDGKIVLGGYHGTTGASDFTVVRLNSNGSLDTTFDSDGIAYADIATSHDGITSLALQPDGLGGEKILMGGYTSGGNFALARFTSAGALDTSFDSDGEQTTDFGSFDQVYAIALSPTGELDVAGDTGSGPNTGGDFAVARYSTGSQRTYVLQDANYNVTAVVDKSGAAAIDRFVYDSYGAQTALDANWNLRPGNASQSGMATGFQGMAYDGIDRTNHTLYREYSPVLGRWVSQDPKSYIDGSSLTLAFRSSPIGSRDYLGLQTLTTAARIAPPVILAGAALSGAVVANYASLKKALTSGDFSGADHFITETQLALQNMALTAATSSSQEIAAWTRNIRQAVQELSNAALGVTGFSALVNTAFSLAVENRLKEIYFDTLFGCEKDPCWQLKLLLEATVAGLEVHRTMVNVIGDALVSVGGKYWQDLFDTASRAMQDAKDDVQMIKEFMYDIGCPDDWINPEHYDLGF